MPTIIKTKNSVTAASAPSSLQQGEVAINITDKKVWVGNAATTPVQLLGGGADGAFTNISVSGVASFADGTVLLPSITNIGDTNTGIYFPDADTIAFTEGGVESMRINSSANVGIGTTSPTVRLDVRSGTGTMFNVQETTSGDNRRIRFSNSGTVNTIESTTTSGSTDLAFAVDGTERMRIVSAGNVGIGETSPTNRLNVKEATNLSLTSGNAQVKIEGSGYSGFFALDATSFQIGQNSNLRSLTFHSGGSMLERMRIDADGDVGIGTTSPTTKLHIDTLTSATAITCAASSTTASQLRLGSGTFQSGRASIDGTGNGLDLGTTTASVPVRIFTNSIERMRVDGSGNMGIGSTSPVSDARLTLGSPTTESYVFFQRTNSGFFDAAIGNNGGNIVFKGNADSSTVAGLSDLMVVTAAGLFQFNSGYGSVATAYGCRAWINFNGTGTPAIRASGNVTSITDNGTGDYTINFTTAFPDANYSVSSTGPSIANSGGAYQVAQNSATAPTTSAYRINVQSTGGTQFDSTLVQLSFFR
jgi:hypothetical protein